jgi:predicted DNA-binding transcriptional regulator AlpA
VVDPDTETDTKADHRHRRKKASTIPEFCEEHRISTAFFYKLKKDGKAPRVTELGARRIVTDEDAAAWRKAMAEASVA